MRVIDLLNKIANGEEVPLKIKVKGYEYRQSNGQFWCDETEMYLIDNCTSIYHFNDEVEIIEDTPKEDKKIEKLSILTFSDLLDMPKEELVDVIKEQRFKINEIIEVLNERDI